MRQAHSLRKESRMPRTTRGLRTINIRELIDALDDALADNGPEALVVFASDYGDIGHTQQVHPIDGVVEEAELEESAYSRSGWAIRRMEDGDEDTEDREDVD